MSTPAFPAHNPDARAQRLAAGAAKRKAEAALVNLHKRQAALQPAARPAPGGDQPASAVRFHRDVYAPPSWCARHACLAQLQYAAERLVTPEQEH